MVCINGETYVLGSTGINFNPVIFVKNIQLLL